MRNRHSDCGWPAGVIATAVALLATAVTLPSQGLAAGCEDNYATARAVRTRADVKAFVRCAGEYLDQHGTEEALRAFTEDERWFASERGIYIFVDTLAASGADSEAVVYPPNPSLHGRAWGPLVDRLGTDLITEFWRVLGDHGEAWVYYSFTNPATGRDEPKQVYSLRVDWNGTAAALGAGIYERDLPGTCEMGEVNAANLDANPSDDVLVEFVRCAAIKVEQMGYFAGPALERDPRWRDGQVYIFVIDAETHDVVFDGTPATDVAGELLDLFHGTDMVAAAVDFGEAFWYYDFENPVTGTLMSKIAYVQRVRVRDKILLVGSGYYPSSSN